MSFRARFCSAQRPPLDSQASYRRLKRLCWLVENAGPIRLPPAITLSRYFSGLSSTAWSHADARAPSIWAEDLAARAIHMSEMSDRDFVVMSSDDPALRRVAMSEIWHSWAPGVVCRDTIGRAAMEYAPEDVSRPGAVAAAMLVQLAQHHVLAIDPPKNYDPRGHAGLMIMSGIHLGLGFELLHLSAQLSRMSTFALEIELETHIAEALTLALLSRGLCAGTIERNYGPAFTEMTAPRIADYCAAYDRHPEVLAELQEQSEGLTCPQAEIISLNERIRLR